MVGKWLLPSSGQSAWMMMMMIQTRPLELDSSVSNQFPDQEALRRTASQFALQSLFNLPLSDNSPWLCGFTARTLYEFQIYLTYPFLKKNMPTCVCWLYSTNWNIFFSFFLESCRKLSSNGIIYCCWSPALWSGPIDLSCIFFLLFYPFFLLSSSFV